MAVERKYTPQALEAYGRILVARGDANSLAPLAPAGASLGEWAEGLPAAYLRYLAGSGRLPPGELFGLALQAAELVTRVADGRTLAVIKPDAVAAGHAGRIVSLLVRRGFRILGCKDVTLTRRQARVFYYEHREEPFLWPLVDFMTSGPVIALDLAREDAVAELRRAIGATHPHEAAPDTVRGLYGTGVPANAIHGSDGPVAAIRETRFFFGFGLGIAEARGVWDGCGLWDDCDKPVPADDIARAMASEESSE